MAKKNKGGGGGGGAPDWLVTFADLMSLLVVFFVLIISFSVQDQEKIQVVSGSIQEAFGVQRESRKYGVIEVPGIPKRDYIRYVTQDPVENVSAIDGTNDERVELPQAKRFNEADDSSRSASEQQILSAAATLRQAWQELPDIAEHADNILIEELPEGLNIQLVDQDGRSMFADGSKFPFEYTRHLLTKLTPVLRKLPNRVVITGHTSSALTGKGFDYTNWDLSADRANAVRQIFTSNGLKPSRIYAVQGKASNDPLFPNDPSLSANSRISVLLLTEAPSAPAGLKP